MFEEGRPVMHQMHSERLVLKIIFGWGCYERHSCRPSESAATDSRTLLKCTLCVDRHCRQFDRDISSPCVPLDFEDVVALGCGFVFAGAALTLPDIPLMRSFFFCCVSRFLASHSDLESPRTSHLACLPCLSYFCLSCPHFSACYHLS